MAKYSNEDLSEMAVEVIEDRKTGGMRSVQVIMSLSLILSVEPEIIIAEIWKRACVE